ncbi:signal peptidase [Pseudonocardia endophytica]|uniref:Signal peptidase I n=1 Tax=Pseudonocardia endophytica TaxID=401976 RepID=A0A4R1HSM0_PSEEN|nr:signal peptidase [Pseudonocardia endophytica]
MARTPEERAAARAAAGSDPVADGPAAPARPSVLRRFLAWLGSLVLLAAVALALAVAVVPAAVGGSALTIESPSMSPTFPVGTLVVIRPRPIDGIRIGDVVSFTDRDPATGATRTVTHRVIGVDPGPLFRTKGDANPSPDRTPVQATQVRGVEWYAIPFVGEWGSKVRSGPGLLLTAGAALLVVALMLLLPRRKA